MKKLTKLMTVGLVLCGMGAGLWLYNIFSAPVPTAEEVEKSQAEELATTQEAEKVVEPEPEEEPYDYTIAYTPEEPEEEISEELLPSVTETVNEDGSVTIDRTWGTKPEGAVTLDDPDGADANMGSGGGEVPVDEDGIYWGEDTASEPETTTTTTESSTSSSSSSGTTVIDGITLPSNPQGGDTYYDENGDLWCYSTIFGWNTFSGESGVIAELEGGGDIIPNAY